MTDIARQAVLDQLATAFEGHAVDEQLERTTDPGEAARHHEAGLACLRARMREEDKPGPLEPPCLCSACIYAYGGRLA